MNIGRLGDTNNHWQPSKGSDTMECSRREMAMHSVILSDPIFLEAQRVAAANGLSVDDYVQIALQAQLEVDAPIRLTSEQAAAIAKAEAEIDAGDIYTARQVREFFDGKRA